MVPGLSGWKFLHCPVAIYESLPVLGGFMKTGIPRYRLPQETLDKEIGFIVSQGGRDTPEYQGWKGHKI